MPVLDMQAFAAKACGIAPAETKADPGSDDLAEMRATHARMRKTLAELHSSVLDLEKSAARLEVEIMKREGRTQTLHYSWLEAWLEGRHEDCSNILASEEYREELRAAATAEVAP